MIDRLEGELEGELEEELRRGNTRRQRKLKLYVYLSYSPCNIAPNHCTTALEHFKKRLQQKKIHLDATIQFSNFYRIYDGCRYTEQNIAGLKAIIDNGFILKTFNGREDWKSFLRDIEFDGNTEECITFANRPDRVSRERKDAKILESIRRLPQTPQQGN